MVIINQKGKILKKVNIIMVFDNSVLCFLVEELFLVEKRFKSFLEESFDIDFCL